MKNTVSTFKEQKVKGDKITMLTAYDYSTAKLMDHLLFFPVSPIEKQTEKSDCQNKYEQNLYFLISHNAP